MGTVVGDDDEGRSLSEKRSAREFTCAANREMAHFATTLPGTRAPPSTSTKFTAGDFYEQHTAFTAEQSKGACLYLREHMHNLLLNDEHRPTPSIKILFRTPGRRRTRNYQARISFYEQSRRV